MHPYYSPLKQRTQHASNVPRARNISPIKRRRLASHVIQPFPPGDRRVPYESHLTANIVAHCERYSQDLQDGPYLDSCDYCGKSAVNYTTTRPNIEKSRGKHTAFDTSVEQAPKRARCRKRSIATGVPGFPYFFFRLRSLRNSCTALAEYPNPGTSSTQI
jgi:hypothetical protein